MEKLIRYNNTEVEKWTTRLTDQVFKGPSASIPINNLCYAAFERGLLNGGGKFDLVREVAKLMYFSQPDLKTYRPLSELDLRGISKKTGIKYSRLCVIAGLTSEFGLIPLTNNNTKF